MITLSVDTFDWEEEKERLRSALYQAIDGSEGMEAVVDRMLAAPEMRNYYIIHLYQGGRDEDIKAVYLWSRLGEIFGLSSGRVRHIAKV